MPDILFVLPVNLYKTHNLSDVSKVYIIEHPVYFTDYKYHKQKLILHRATMKYYVDYVKKKYREFKNKIHYVDFFNYDGLFARLPVNSRIIFYDPVDHDTLRDLTVQCKKHKFEFVQLDTKTFLTPRAILEEYNNNHDGLVQYNFYKFQRQRLDILMKDDNKPVGGSWSFDVENRKTFPATIKINDVPKEVNNEYINDARNYVNKYFSNNPGSDFFWLPIDHKGAKLLFDKFIKNKLFNFGPYQDAVSDKIFAGYHSTLSPLINIGLLDPKEILKKVVDNINIRNHKSLVSGEAYIRQLIGWREYCRLIYTLRYKELEGNYFNNKARLSKNWFKDKENYTGITFIDDLIKKTWNYAYLHHIERLMYIGNFTLILGVLPTDVYDWFQSMFLDSYAVFMYPNVFGMSQHSSGPVMMTKPYFSSAAYINKMSTFKTKINTYPKIIEHEWFEIWNALYYSFINKNKKKLESNYGTASQVMHWKNKTNKEKKQLLDLAAKYKRYLNKNY